MDSSSNTPLENNSGTSTGPKTLIEHCSSIRSLMNSWKESVLKLKSNEDLKREQGEGENHGEAIANIMLAYRHMEDAKMRLGLVIQAMDGGVSIYDKQK